MSQAVTSPELSIIPRDSHPVSRKDISDSALKVLYRLKDAGYESYLVGGCIRDLLLGKHPKDFDVTTEATPEEVHALFKNSRLIGRRFKLVHVRFGREIIEVATFRANHDSEENAENHLGKQDESGRILRDNVYGTVEEDAIRRDFTVNALYYSINDFGIHDYTRGLDDLNNRTLRMIGDPEARYREDPVRMLRAVRFAAKLEFLLSDATEAPIQSLAPLLNDIPAARLFDEVLKLFLAGQGAMTFDLLRHFKLLQPLFPATDKLLETDPEGNGKAARNLIMQALRNTDQRIKDDKSVTPAFLFAAMLWQPLQVRIQTYLSHGMPVHPAYQKAAQEVIQEQCHATAIPRRFSIPIREIWDLQSRLPRRFGKRADLLLQHPRFRAAYDFLLMREAAGENLDGLGKWWTDYQKANREERQQLLKKLDANLGKRPSRKKRPTKRKAP